MLKNIWKWLFMYFRKNPDKIPCLYYYHMTLTLSTQLHIIKAVIFPIVMYGCETWTIKDEHWRNDALELWCWKNLLRIPWTARRSNQSILKGINPAYSTWGLMLKLNLFRPLEVKSRCTGKDPDAGKDWGQKEKREVKDEMVRYFIN